MKSSMEYYRERTRGIYVRRTAPASTVRPNPSEIHLGVLTGYGRACRNSNGRQQLRHAGELCMTDTTLLRLENVSRRLAGRNIVENVVLSLDRGSRSGAFGRQRRRQDHHLTHDLRRPGAQPGPCSGRWRGHARRPQPRRRSTGLPAGGAAAVSGTARRRIFDVLRPSAAHGRQSRLRRPSTPRSNAADLATCADRLIGNLSKGYQQRVGIAQAIVHDPALIVLDEPASGLDPLQSSNIRALIRELGKDRAVILSTHLIADVNQCCDRVAILHRGRAALRRPRAAACRCERLAGAHRERAAAWQTIVGVQSAQFADPYWHVTTNLAPEQLAETIVAQRLGPDRIASAGNQPRTGIPAHRQRRRNRGGRVSLVIARNELRRIFLTPLAWVLLAAVLGVLGYFFLLSLGAFLALMPKIAGMADAPGVTDLVVLPLLRATASLLLIVAPLLGMRAIAGDRQNGKPHPAARRRRRRCAHRDRKILRTARLRDRVHRAGDGDGAESGYRHVARSRTHRRGGVRPDPVRGRADRDCGCRVIDDAIGAARGVRRADRQSAAVDARCRRALRRREQHVHQLSRAADASGAVPARHRGERGRGVFPVDRRRRARARRAARLPHCAREAEMGERLLDVAVRRAAARRRGDDRVLQHALRLAARFQFCAAREPRCANAHAARKTRCADRDRFLRAAGQSAAQRDRRFRRALRTHQARHFAQLRRSRCESGGDARSGHPGQRRTGDPLQRPQRTAQGVDRTRARQRVAASRARA